MINLARDNEMPIDKNRAWFRIDVTYSVLGCLPDPRVALRCRNRSRNACNACTYTSRLLVVPYHVRGSCRCIRAPRTYVRTYVYYVCRYVLYEGSCRSCTCSGVQRETCTCCLPASGRRCRTRRTDTETGNRTIVGSQVSCQETSNRDKTTHNFKESWRCL